MPTTVPFTAEGSILAWEKEAVRSAAPSTAAAWQEFGRISEWNDLGPRQVVSRDFAAGAGQEPHEIQAEGAVYGGTLGPFQVRDPRLLGFYFSKEVTRVAAAPGFHRHRLEPTDRGRLDSFSVGMRDRALDGSGLHESIIYLESILPRFALRGEAIQEDGSGGRLLAAVDVWPHDHTTVNADQVTVALGTATPYRFSHGIITLDGEQVFRVNDFELTGDRRASYAYYWQNVDADKPYEAPPEGSLGKLTLNLVADGETYVGNTQTVRELLRSRTKFNAKLLFRRVTDQDEFAFDLTDLLLEDAPARRSQGKVTIRTQAPVRKMAMEYVDSQNSAYFST